MNGRSINRRTFASLVGAGMAGMLAGCIGPGARGGGATVAGDRLNAALDAHRRAMDLHGAGLVVQRGGETLYAGAVGTVSGLSPAEMDRGVPQRAFRPDTPFRVASMSKAVVAHAAVLLARTGQIDLDADVQPLLGFDLRHPEAPGAPITLAMLLSHTSGIRDPAAYWVSAPGAIGSVMGGGVFAPLGGQPLGAYFEYANLNFGLAATAMERATGERFDALAQRLVLAPAGVDVGFNWSGMSPDRRRAGATLYRRDERGKWAVQTDGPDALAGDGPVVLANEGFDLSTYRPGTNGTMFSPQGGLRASLLDLAVLAQRHADQPEMVSLRWLKAPSGDNGLHDGGYFAGSGLGLVSYPVASSPFAGRMDGPVWGHQGEAYGVHGAFWKIPEADVTLVYVALGVPETAPLPAGRHPGLNAYVEPLADLGMARLA